jgi:hypothetical protein
MRKLLGGAYEQQDLLETDHETRQWPDVFSLRFHYSAKRRSVLHEG